jgi:hypothetical protein
LQGVRDLKTFGYLKAGMSAANFADDSNGVNFHALPIRGIEVGMLLLLNLGVWIYAAAEFAGVMPPVSLPGPGP